MLVELSIGGQSRKVIASLKKSIDDVDFYSHTSMPAFIKEAEARKLQFKRIVMTPAMLSKKADKDFKKLNEYIKGYSPNTEIVLFTTGGNRVETFKDFDLVFNSPLYTTIDLSSVTIVNISKLITASIEEIGRMEGGKKYGEDKDSSQEEENPLNSSNTGVQSSNQSVSNNMGVNLYKDPVNTESGTGKNMFESQGKGFDFGHISETPVLGEPNVGNPSNFGGGDEDDLSLGEFGNSHSDTGYLDEGEEENDKELQEFLKQKEQGEKEVEEQKFVKKAPVKIKKKPQKEEEISVPILNPEEIEDPKPKRPNIDLVIACSGTGSTQEIVDQAAKIVNQDKVKVLLVDLDNTSNGLLSFIDTNRFYMESAYQGITKQRVYMEDGIGIASDGYGFKVKSKDLKNFLLGKCLDGYDMVYIDCPADCLYSLDVDILKMCSNILIMSGTDLSQMVATSLALTCRDTVSVGVERYIMNNCFVEFVGALDSQSVEYLKEICLFANGSWLDRIGL